MFIYRRRLKPREVSQLGDKKPLTIITQVAVLTKALRLSRKTFKVPRTLLGSLNRSGLQFPFKTLGARADTEAVAPGSAARAPEHRCRTREEQRSGKHRPQRRASAPAGASE